MSTATAFTTPPPAFNLDDLPRPFVQGRQDWIDSHDMAWRLAHQHIGHHEGLAAEWFMDEACMPDRLWQWDTCFMVLYTAYAPHVFPGIQSLDNFYAWQKDDGFIAMCTLFATGEPAYGERVNPPLFAWIEWDYYRHTGDDSRFKRVLPTLVKYFDWIKANRRRPRIVSPDEELNPSNVSAHDSDGLYWATAPGAMGMDNSPRGMHLSWTGGETAWIDLSSQQALAALYLQRIATHIGDEQTARRFKHEYADITHLVNQWMWCDRTRFYHDIFLDGNYLSCKTAAGFWPMLGEFASQEQAAALVGHLLNPNEFARPHPVPSLSYDDPNYCESGAYWLGGVWAPTNYMIVRGLHQYGYGDVAHDIAVKHLDGIAGVRQQIEPSTIWEAYAPEQVTPSTDKSKVNYARPDFCGWSAMGATAMFYENVIGIRRDTPARTLTWDIRLDQPHGFERYPFLGTNIELRYANGQVTINSPVEFTLKWHRGSVTGTTTVTGQTQIECSQ